jgi:folate-binding protein YgfZ
VLVTANAEAIACIGVVVLCPLPAYLMTMPIAFLDDRAVIAVSGPEARPFLQGLITNDIAILSPAQPIYGALLTPQGKVLFDFLISEGDGALLLDCANASHDLLVKRLSTYRLRAKVTIESRDQLAVAASWDGANISHVSAFTDPRVAELGKRAICARAELPGNLSGASTYHEFRHSLGVPEGVDFGSDRMFALDADLEELHGVSFDKGCFVGQELTARMKHRGTARKRLVPVSAASTLPPPFAPVRAGSRELGELASANGQRGFALLRLDRLAEADPLAIEVAGVPLTIERPAWLFS